jgi:hypothetical protein
MFIEETEGFVVNSLVSFLFIYMSDLKKLHGVELRDIVKEYAEYYRNTEISRINKEEITHFISLNPEYKEVEQILKNFIE